MIKRFLKKLIDSGVKRKEIIDALGITHAYLSKLERGAEPSVKLVLKLADHYGVSLDEIFDREKDGVVKEYNQRNGLSPTEQTRRRSNSMADLS
jgi:transcriptional regulator with XRE-family HTH domain